MWVVVLFGGKCEETELSHCPIEVLGPYESSEVAKRIAAAYPTMLPHVLRLD